MGTGYQPDKKLWVPKVTGYQREKKLWVPMGTGYRPDKKLWVPMGTGCRPLFLEKKGKNVHVWTVRDREDCTRAGTNGLKSMHKSEGSF